MTVHSILQSLPRYYLKGLNFVFISIMEFLETVNNITTVIVEMPQAKNQTLVVTNSIELQKKDSWLEFGQLSMLLRILVLMTNRLTTFDDFHTENICTQIQTNYHCLFQFRAQMSLSNHNIYTLQQLYILTCYLESPLLYVVRNFYWSNLQAHFIVRKELFLLQRNAVLCTKILANLI